MQTTPRFTIITVTYNNGAFLRPMLEALFAQPRELFEAILVENNSRDNSLQIAREFESRGLQVIANIENKGFGGGNNQAALLAKGEILFLLNPDAILPLGALEQISTQINAQSTPGIFGLRLLSMDGHLLMHYGISVGDQAHCLAPYRGKPEAELLTKPMLVEAVSGATMLVPRAIWEKLGGFDLGFHPAYYEDTDLCLRAQRLKIPVVSLPVNVRHHENVSEGVQSWAFLHMHHRHRWRLIAKHFSLFRILFRTLPKELYWLCSWRSQRVRKITLKSIWQAIPVYFQRR